MDRAPFKGHHIDVDVDVEVDVDMDRYFGCLKGVSKSVQVLFNGIEAFLVLTLMILKQRALLNGLSKKSLVPF